MRPSRREFLGFLGLALLSPVGSAAAVKSRCAGGGAYLGPVRDLIESIPLDPGWGVQFFALIESIDRSPAEWIISEVSAIGLTPLCQLEDLPASLRSRGVLRACEADFSPTTEGEPSSISYFVDVTLFEDVARCEIAWEALMSIAEEAGLDPFTGLGEAAVLSRGKWSVPGKVFFRRGNVLTAVAAVPWTDETDARRFALYLDRRIAILISREKERDGAETPIA